MPSINLWAALGAVISAFLLEGLWYGPLLFREVWQQAAQLSDERIKGGFERKASGSSWSTVATNTAQFTLYKQVSGLRR